MQCTYGEEFIREKECKEREWNDKYKEQEKEYIDFIEKKLREGTAKARNELLKLFRDNKFMSIYQQRNDIAYMVVIMKIYEVELCNNEEKTILDMGNTIDELHRKITELKFIIWRIEFEKDKSAFEKMLEYIRINQATPYMIRQIISTSVFEKGQVLIMLTDVFLAHNMFRYAFSMLDYLNELSPGNEEVLCMLAELCGYVGNYEKVKEYLEQISEPGELSERIKEKYGC